MTRVAIIAAGSRDELERVRSAGETLHIQVLGLVMIADDVGSDLARDIVASLQVLDARGHCDAHDRLPR